MGLGPTAGVAGEAELQPSEWPPVETRSVEETSVGFVLDLFSIGHRGDETRVRVLDVPFFSLYRGDRTGEDRVSTRFVRLPLIGSLYGHERDEDGERRDILFLIHLRNSTEPTSLP